MSSTPNPVFFDSETQNCITNECPIIIKESELSLTNGLNFLKRFRLKKKTKKHTIKPRLSLRLRKPNRYKSSNSSLPETSSTTISNFNKYDACYSDYLETSLLSKKRFFQEMPKCSWDSRDSEVKHTPKIESFLCNLFTGLNSSKMLTKAFDNSTKTTNDWLSQAKDKSLDHL